MAARLGGRSGGLLASKLSDLKTTTWSFARRNREQKYSSKARSPIDFGLFFDIDGVIVRGRQLLPSAREAFRHLTNDQGQFFVPTIFVTNAGNVMRHAKAKQLSDWLQVEVTEDQVVMSHSPLKMFQQFMDKHVMVVGQGPTKEIAKGLGFTNVTTIETFRHCFPKLDMVDHARRKTAPCAFEKYFPRIEAVIMFGEPVRWETNLQLIIDVLLTNGHPTKAPSTIPYPHIPVLACNMDLLWMSEASMPRFAHGSFLRCVESIYKKISGYELKYTALVGKPSEITYHHAEDVLRKQSTSLGLPNMRRMYCIGDNPDVDIYGANLFDRYLKRRQSKHLKARTVKVNAGVQSVDDFRIIASDDDLLDDDVIPVSDDDEDNYIGLEDTRSVLVCTGVYDGSRDHKQTSSALNHNHRDFILDPELRNPTLVSNTVLEAVRSILRREGMS